MSLDDDLGPLPKNEAPAEAVGVRENQGIRTHVFLVIAMALVIAVVTGLSLLLIRHQLSKQVTDDLSQDLDRSVTTFNNLQAERLKALERENSLLATLPTLKALMTSGDDLTIQDEAADFWRLSGADLFVLADPSGRIVAAYAQNSPADDTLRQGLKILYLASPDKHYLITTVVRSTRVRPSHSISAAIRKGRSLDMSSVVFQSTAQCGKQVSLPVSKLPFSAVDR